MTPALRKIHRYTWYSLAVLLPVGWLAAVVAIPDAVWQTPVRAELPAPLPLVSQSKESGDFIVNLRRDSLGDRRQVEVIIKKPLTNPNTTLILNDRIVLGLLETRGIRRFDLDSLAARAARVELRFEDKIRQRVLRTVVFE